jgi:hypothetical protein
MWLSKSDRNDWVDAFSFSYRGVEFEVGAFRILFEEGGLVSEVAELIVFYISIWRKAGNLQRARFRGRTPNLKLEDFGRTLY